MRQRIGWVLVLAVASVPQLGCPKKAVDKCEFVGCPPPSACDPADGLCKGGLDAGQDAGSSCGVCPAATPVCSGTTCVTCTATQGCNALAPVCDLSASGGQCVQCLQSTDCPALTPVCANKICFPADGGLITNDSCASPAALTFSNSVASVAGTTQA